MGFWIELSELLRNFGFAAAGAVGAWLAFMRLRPASAQASAATEQAELAQRNLSHRLFRDATNDLGAENLEVRVAALFVLDNLSADYPLMDYAAIQVISAYLRRRDQTYDSQNPPIDVVTATSIIEERLTLDGNTS
ncbi:MAG: hypothetical protein AAF141_10130 [Pseudomonadota bacterium]